MSRPSAADDFLTIRARTHKLRRENRLHAADDFATIRARIDELHRENAAASTAPGSRFLAILFEIAK